MKHRICTTINSCAEFSIRTVPKIEDNQILFETSKILRKPKLLSFSNISRSKKNTQNNQNIVILPEDKSNATVILTTFYYV